MSARHTLQLADGERIDYRLERRARRTIGLKVGQDGLIVHAPQRIGLAMLEDALRQKSGWIRQKLRQWADDRTAPIVWRDQGTLLLLGEEIRLHLSRDVRDRAAEFEAGQLFLRLVDIDDETAVARKVVQWYRKAAVPDFSRRLALHAARLGVATPPLYLSSARRRWGSCNSKREIRINWRLLQAPPQLINYVICHELAHLKEMNHSARFWAIVAELYPEYRSAERALRDWSARLHRL